MEAVKAGMAGSEEILSLNGMNVDPAHPELNVPLEQCMHDEL